MGQTRRPCSHPKRTSRGFSLLEMVVAISILGMSLAALYQAVSGATRNVRTDERYAYGVELARSLLADNSKIPAGGLDRSGETSGGFHWAVSSYPVDVPESVIAQGGLQGVDVTIGWADGSKWREIALSSVVEGMAE